MGGCVRFQPADHNHSKLFFLSLPFAYKYSFFACFVCRLKIKSGKQKQTEPVCILLTSLLGNGPTRDWSLRSRTRPGRSVVFKMIFSQPNLLKYALQFDFAFYNRIFSSLAASNWKLNKTKFPRPTCTHQNQTKTQQTKRWGSSRCKRKLIEI